MYIVNINSIHMASYHRGLVARVLLGARVVVPWFVFRPSKLRDSVRRVSKGAQALPVEIAQSQSRIRVCVVRGNNRE